MAFLQQIESSKTEYTTKIEYQETLISDLKYRAQV
jgi:hypothetical protein